MKTINFKIENIELRKTSLHSYPYYEIVKWFQREKCKTCITLLYWIYDKEGIWEIKFVGDRPFTEEVNPKDLWKLMTIGQDLLNE